MARNTQFLFALISVGGSLCAMDVSMIRQTKMITSSSQPRERAVALVDVPAATRMSVPLPTEHHMAAVELFDRILLCFIDSAVESVRREGLRFLLDLENILHEGQTVYSKIEECDGPLADVWFRSPVTLPGTVETLENTLQGYFKEIAQRNEFMAGPATKVLQILEKQKMKFQMTKKAVTHTAKLTERSCKRWSVPNSCWVEIQGADFYDPSAQWLKRNDYRSNLVDTMERHMKDDDEQFRYFLSDLEAHVHSPHFASRFHPSDWLELYDVDERALRKAYGVADFDWSSPAGKKFQDRFGWIQRILKDRISSRGPIALPFQNPRRVEDPQLTVYPLLLERLTREAQRRAQEEAPVVLAIARKPGDLQALTGQPAQSAEERRARLRLLLKAAGKEEMLALPAPAVAPVGRVVGEIVPAGMVGKSTTGPKIEEVD